MKMNDAYPGQYLRTEDFQSPRTLTITGVEMEDVGGAQTPGEVKPVLQFEEENRGFVLNKTNFAWLADNLGEDSESWIGKQVELYQTETNYGGKLVPCTRIRAAEQQSADVPF